jgi:hypothetical protein
MVTKPLYLYESDLLLVGSGDNVIGQIRLNPQVSALDVEGATNIEPTGPPNTTEPIRSQGTRRYGIIARHIIISQIVSGARIYRRVPILTNAFFINIISTVAPAITYEGSSSWLLVGGMGERYHLVYAVGT